MTVRIASAEDVAMLAVAMEESRRHVYRILTCHGLARAVTVAEVRNKSIVTGQGAVY